MEKFGVDNIKKLLKFGCDLTKQIAISSADGWQWTDSFSFINEITQLPGVIKALPAIKDELADLSSDERKELNDWFEQEFDLPNDKLEGQIEKALNFVILLLDFIESWKQKPAEEPADAPPVNPS